MPRVSRTAETGTISIPADALRSCNLHAGDDVEPVTAGSTIRTIPTVEYSEEYIEVLKAELQEMHRLGAEGKTLEYSCMVELLADLNSDAAN